MGIILLISVFLIIQYILKSKNNFPATDDNISLDTQSVNVYDAIIGTWNLKTEIGITKTLMHQTYDKIIIYEDGTFKLGDTTDGTWNIVHDGNTLQLNNKFGNQYFYDFEIIDGLLYMTADNGQEVVFDFDYSNVSSDKIMEINSSNPILGTWLYSNEEDEARFTFDENGVLEMWLNGEMDYGTYELLKDSSTLIVYSGDEKPESIKYKIDGNELTMSDGVDSIVFERIFEKN